MKILKDTKTALLLKSFLLNNQDYLSISVLYYFDLNNPEAPLEEQAMYRETGELLGKTLLDYAMPKLKAEVLLCGNCHNYTPQSGASHVKLKVNSVIDKELYVFGERRWSKGIITKPLPFKTMPLDYAHAVKHGELLPNIEDPKHLITSKDDEIEPASYMPTDINSQQNMKKLGTFGGSYKRELWPGFAADMDYSFFNVAPKGQIQDKFFTGDEKIEIFNMHPKKQLLTSYIPQTSFRCFSTKEHGDKEEEDEFKEIKLQRDTLWLFPEIEKGIVIFRGTLEVSDEIYSNVKYLNIKPVFQDDKPKTLDEYYELQKKELGKSIEFDEAPFKQADKEIAEAQKEIFDIPREMKESIEATTGKRPVLKTTPLQQLEESHERIDSAIARIKSSKEKLKDLKEEFGHIVKIDTDAFGDAEGELLALKKQTADLLQTVTQDLLSGEEMKKDALADIQKIKQNPKISEYAGDMSEFDFLKAKEKFWSDYAFDFVCEGIHVLRKHPDELHRLRHLGLANRTMQRAWIGFNPKTKTIRADEWKLESKDDMELPKGLITVRFEEATLKAFRINDKPILGSDEAYELFLSEENYDFPLFYFKEDLQAHLCDQEAFDICNSLVCDDILSVGDDAKEALQRASVVFYLKEDDVIEKLPQARKFDCGEYKNLFELHQNGIEIRDQIVQNLPKEMRDLLPIERDVSAKAIMEKSKKFTDRSRADLKAEAEKLRKEAEADRDEILARANEILAKKGLDPVVPPTETSSGELITSSEVKNIFDKAIDRLKKQEIQSGIDLKVKISEFEKAKDEMVALAQRGETMYTDGMQKIAEAEEKVKDPIPNWAKDMMKEAGIDPDNPHTDDLTREDVIKLYAEGESFEGKNLSKLDLSELDLSGIDLTMANCEGTNFKNTDLSGAKLEQTNFTNTNFTKTDLRSAKASMTIFKKSTFEKTVFDDTFMDMVLFDGSVIENSRFNNSTLDGVIFQNLTMKKPSFDNSSLINVSFLNSSLKRGDFSNSKMENTLFNESEINDTLFSYMDSKATLFNQSKVSNCDFSRAKLYNMRAFKQSSLKKCDFSYCDMQKSTVFEALISECNLQKANLSKSLIKKSQIDKCDFRGVVAKGSRFEYATCMECSFVGINLLRGSLRRMDLKICDLSRSNLYGVEFYKTKLYKVKFDGANLKRSNLEDRVELIYD